MPIRSPPSRVEVRSALTPLMNMSLALSGGSFNLLSSSRMLIPRSMLKLSDEGGMNSRKVANNFI